MSGRIEHKARLAKPCALHQREQNAAVGEQYLMRIVHFESDEQAAGEYRVDEDRVHVDVDLIAAVQVECKEKALDEEAEQTERVLEKFGQINCLAMRHYLDDGAEHEANVHGRVLGIVDFDGKPGLHQSAMLMHVSVMRRRRRHIHVAHCWCCCWRCRTIMIHHRHAHVTMCAAMIVGARQVGHVGAAWPVREQASYCLDQEAN